MSRILKFFRSLRGKLVLTYTLVTVLALLALEVLAISVILLLSGIFTGDTWNYVMDCAYYLAPQARAFLKPGAVDTKGLQSWLEGIYQSGYASLPAQGVLDSPAAPIVRSDPMYVLSPQGVVLAQAPTSANSLVGRVYTQPVFYGGGIYSRKPDGSLLVELPVHEEVNSAVVIGTLVFTVKPPPPVFFSIWPVLLVAVLITALLLLIGVAPFGTLFGFVMSRPLTRRLAALTAVADAWSEGNFNVSPQDRAQDEISYLGVRMRRMAERIQALLQARQELAMMEERNRLARELHDTVKQQTFATLMQVRAARNLIKENPLEAEERLMEAESLIKTAQQELGLMITELRPAALEGQGLAGALHEFLSAWTQHARIPAELKVQNEQPLPLDLEQALYRVAQEALSNVARHSRASAVDVRLEYQPARVQLTIRDNGCGFDLKQAAPDGFGLQSMRERMAALGGKLVVESEPGMGAVVTASAPSPLMGG